MLGDYTFILVTSLTEKALILQREIWRRSLLEQKGLNDRELSFKRICVMRRWESETLK